jgi:hypothetical protein
MKTQKQRLAAFLFAALVCVAGAMPVLAASSSFKILAMAAGAAGDSGAGIGMGVFGLIALLTGNVLVATYAF